MTAFHAGELLVQERAGVRERVAALGERMIQGTMPEQHRELFGKLPMLLVGSLDAVRRPWASVVLGNPGFVSAPDARHLRIAAQPGFGDPLAGNLVVGAPLGLLGLEPHTRRRNRMNGTVVQLDTASFTVAVDQSFGNCPQYIQAREPNWRRDPASFGEPRSVQHQAAALSAEACRLLRAADTIFIATASPRAAAHAGAEGVDVSHRGGRPGFVRVEAGAGGEVVLTLPDFRGNNLFNTLGNIAAHPRAGLLVMDAATGDLLQVTGRAEIVWEGAALASFAGALRLVRIVLEDALWQPQAVPLAWSAPAFALQLAATGTWEEPPGGDAT